MSGWRMNMKDWIQRLDAIIQLNRKELFSHAGEISHEMALAKSSAEYGKYKDDLRKLECKQSLLRRAAQLQRALPSVPEKEYAKQVAEALAADPSAMGTEVEAIVKRRVGQSVFRKALMDYWGSQCAVTGVAIPEVLRSSHCKPWADCRSDAERLDVYNGLLLTANLDALFDKGLITFTDQGGIIISETLFNFRCRQNPEIRHHCKPGLKRPLPTQRH